MYLKTLAVLGGGDRPVAAAVVADRLRVTPVAASEMLRRLMSAGLVAHEMRHGYRLTSQGREAAWDVIRRQRLWERFLVDHLGLGPAAAPGWACQLEHATAPEVLDALDAFLRVPATCPHGQPIPRSPADRVQRDERSLANADLGEAVRLVAFDDEDPEILDYLYRIGLTIGIVVRVADIGPLGSLLSLEAPSGTVVLGHEVAATIRTAAVTVPAGSAGAAAAAPEAVGAAGGRRTTEGVR